jgi:TetR/AcrR family transcriptional repressor of bet genes
MQRVADRQARRRQITDALSRITLEGGLATVSFREVAEEAGVSVRLVQYYFGTKDELLLAAWQELSGRTVERILERMREHGRTTPRRVIGLIVEGFLPLDQERRDAALLFIAFHTASLTDASLARAEARALPQQLATFLELQLRIARDEGMLASGVHARHASRIVVTVIIGLAHLILSGTYTPEEGAAAARAHVASLFR